VKRRCTCVERENERGQRRKLTLNEEGREEEKRREALLPLSFSAAMLMTNAESMGYICLQ
jgi:hypothetical protein